MFVPAEETMLILYAFNADNPVIFADIIKLIFFPEKFFDYWRTLFFNIPI